MKPLSIEIVYKLTIFFLIRHNPHENFVVLLNKFQSIMDKLFRKDAFNYHALGRPGKVEVIPTKPYSTQRDLSLA